MKKILIATPPGLTADGQHTAYYPPRYSYATGKFKKNSFYPYELAYLSSMLKQRAPQYRVKMVDPSFYSVGWKEYADILIELSPDILIVETDYLVYKELMKAYHYAAEQGLQCILILCGVYASAFSEKCLDEGADYVAIGEFEESICRFIENDFSLPAQGIYPDTTPILVDPEALPFPEDHDIKRRNYCRTQMSEYNAVEVYASRGCPFSCDFCVARHLYYKKPNHRKRDVKNVIAEIKYLFDSIEELECVFFNEDTHGADPSYVCNLCNAIIDAGLNHKKYMCLTNYFTLDKELLTLMKKAGYYKLSVGVESLDSEVTNSILSSGQKSDSSQLMDFLHNCRELGISVSTTVTVGAQGASMESDYQTVRALEDLYDRKLIQELQPSINQPIPGTPFHRLCSENNWFDQSRMSKLYPDIPVVSYPNYSAAQIETVYSYLYHFMQMTFALNINRGIKYSNHDAEGWCKPVYDLKHRKSGMGIVDKFSWD